MPRSLSFFLLIALICCLFACNKAKDPSKDIPVNIESAIAGKWNMKKQVYSFYIDSVKKADTTVFSSADDESYLQFDKSNGAYTSVSHYFLNVNGTPTAMRDSSSGAYGIVDKTFNYNFRPTQLNISAASAPFTNAITSAMELLYYKVTVVQADNSSLTLHVQYASYYHPSPYASETFTFSSDCYYGR